MDEEDNPTSNIQDVINDGPTPETSEKQAKESMDASTASMEDLLDTSISGSTILPNITQSTIDLDMTESTIDSNPTQSTVSPDTIKPNVALDLTKSTVGPDLTMSTVRKDTTKPTIGLNTTESTVSLDLTKSTVGPDATGSKQTDTQSGNQDTTKPSDTTSDSTTKLTEPLLESEETLKDQSKETLPEESALEEPQVLQTGAECADQVKLDDAVCETPAKLRKLDGGTPAVESESLESIETGSTSQEGIETGIPSQEGIETGSTSVPGEPEVISGMDLRKNRKRKLKDDPEKKQPEPFLGNSTYDKVRIIIQPWRKPEGGVNKAILKMMLESVMLYLMMNPGSTDKTLLNRYQPYLQPMVLRTIIEILEDIGCVTRQYLKVAKVSLFSAPSLPCVGDEDHEDTITLYIPTEECLFRMGQFGKEMFPKVEWPSSTTYMGRV